MSTSTLSRAEQQALREQRRGKLELALVAAADVGERTVVLLPYAGGDAGRRLTLELAGAVQDAEADPGVWRYRGQVATALSLADAVGGQLALE